MNASRGTGIEQTGNSDLDRPNVQGLLKVQDLTFTIRVSVPTRSERLVTSLSMDSPTHTSSNQDASTLAPGVPVPGFVGLASSFPGESVPG